eukprot:6211133-Pleurochrysis_carterae.AAC.3
MPSCAMNSRTPQCKFFFGCRGLMISNIIGYEISKCASFSRQDGGRMILSEYSSRSGSRCCSAARRETE